jgi:glutamate carboxypeptidase
MKRVSWTFAAALVLHGMAVASEPMAPPYRALLEEIVAINTDTRNTEGLARLRDVLVPRFEALGLKAVRHRIEPGREVLSFEVPDAKPDLLLLGHLDTVFPPTSTFRSVRWEADRVHGPGVIDMKGGVVLMLNVLERLRGTRQLQRVRVVLNDDEEIGSPHSKHVIRKLAAGLTYGLVFEPGLEDGAFVSSQSGVRWLRLTSIGKAAHAGLEPENGIDACLDLAHKVRAVTGLAEPAKGLTINPGVIEGGTKPNVVCEKASVTLDVRFRDASDWQRVSSAIDEIAERSDVFNPRLQQGTKTEKTLLAEMPMLPSAITDELVQHVQALSPLVGQKVTARGVGYGSDGNHLADIGIRLLVGVGPYGGGMHSDKEFMLLNSYRERLELLIGLIQTKLSPYKRSSP